MRILIVSYFFPPLHAVASLRPESWARTWAEMGHDVTVLTVPKDRLPVTSGRAMPPSVNIIEIGLPEVFYLLRMFHQKRIQPVPGANTSPHGLSLTRRLLIQLDDFRLRRGLFATVRMPDATDLWIRPALRWGRNAGEWDLVVSTAGPYATHLIGAQLKIMNLTHFWVADYRDLWTDSPTCAGLFPFTVIERRLERRAMRWADLLTTVSRPLADILAVKYGLKKVEVIENGFDSVDTRRLVIDSIFPADGKVRIVYTGSINKGNRDPSPLFDAIHRLAQENNTRHLLGRLEIVFCGSMTRALIETVEKYEVGPWVRLLASVPRTEALRMQRDAHALLFLEWAQGEVDGILSGKLFEYISAGTPIWGIGVTERTATGGLIQETKAGILFGTDVPKLTRELQRLLISGKKERIHVQPHLLARYERRTLATHLLELVNERMSA